MRIIKPFLNVYKKKDKHSELVTQLLYGETFKKIKKSGSWLKIKNDSDKYVGFIKNINFSKNQKNTHKICSIKAPLYKKPNTKYKIKTALSFGSRIKIIDSKGIFCKFDNFWIKKKYLKKINEKNKNLFFYINKFIGIKYVWGAKNYGGVDCSALVQLCINYNNKFCPRDTSFQIRYFKKKIRFKNIKKNDLIFWKGHVAVVISKKKLIHAYGPYKKVVVMPIKKTVKTIYETANLKIIGIRRPF